MSGTMPLDIQSVSAFACEHFLIEKDDVFSAIRIVDVFFLPAKLPENAAFEINFLVIIKCKEEGQARLALKLIAPDGSENDARGDIPELVEAKRKATDPNIPTGVTLALRLNVNPKALGTHLLRIELDGVKVAEAAFTLRVPDKQS